MPPMTRTTPDPLKQMRQKQAAEAKLLAAQNKQREGIRREQEKIRAAEAAEKKANAERLETQPPLRPQQQKTSSQTQARPRR
jgi:hypothetical protein